MMKHSSVIAIVWIMFLTAMVEVCPVHASAMVGEGVLSVDSTTAISPDNRVIYELNLYDFTSAGTLNAAAQRLPELRRLGIDIIWLMPIYPRGVQGKIGSLGSPYAPRDYMAVNPAHGSLADLQAFVSQAHSLGMSVWLDWVPNHTGLDHVWVSSHPEYYVWQGSDIVHPSNYGDVYQLNYGSADLCNAMTEAMLYWVEQADIDGFRCDYVSSQQIPLSYWQQAIPALQNNTRGKRVEMMGEADFTSRDASHLLQAGFDYDYAWGYADGLKSVGTGTNAANAKSAAQTLLNALSSNYTNMSRMAYLTNHDDIGDNFCCNYMTQCGANVAPLTVMYFTFFGMPLLYNGQEIGSTAILNYFNRNTINWSSVNTRLHNTIRALIALKHTQPALADGKASSRATTRMLNTNNNSVIAFERTKSDNTVLVVISLSDQPVQVTLSSVTAGDYTRVLDSQTITQGFSTTTATLSSSPVISLPAKGYHVYTNRVTPPRTCHIYVDDQTGWSTFDLYEWGTPHEVFGAWPGETNPPMVDINGTAWRDYAYTVSEETTEVELNLIFHNNVGEGRQGDYRQLITLTEPRDYYLTVPAEGDIMEGERSLITYHLYVENSTGWQNFFLYAWGDKEFFGSWPGVQSTAVNTVSHEGVDYLDFQYDIYSDVTDMNMNLIFHNNVGEGRQGDYRQLITLTEPRDYYLTVTHTGIEDLPTAVNTLSYQPIADTQKLLRNGQLLIRRADHLYDARGIMIR